MLELVKYVKGVLEDLTDDTFNGLVTEGFNIGFQNLGFLYTKVTACIFLLGIGIRVS